MPRRKVRLEERNDNPIENLVNDLNNAEEEGKTAAEEIRNDAVKPKDEPNDNVDKAESTVGAFIRRQRDRPIGKVP